MIDDIKETNRHFNINAPEFVSKCNKIDKNIEQITVDDLFTPKDSHDGDVTVPLHTFENSITINEINNPQFL